MPYKKVEIKVHLCAKTGSYLRGLDPAVIQSIDVQRDVSKDILGGFNQAGSKNIKWIGYVLSQKSDVRLRIWDTTVTPNLGLRLGEFNDPSLIAAVYNYGAIRCTRKFHTSLPPISHKI